MLKWELVRTEPLLSRSSWIMGRTPVPGGWLVFVRSNLGESGHAETVSLTFYPDPDHSWQPL